MNAPAGGSPGGDFQLAEWLVQPSLNRISDGARTVQLEPKQMDVLAFLACHAGEVVSKDAIADAVWRQKYYSEWVITRAIAALRRALGDDARQPRFIETISKRGYRLLFPGEVLPAPTVAPALPGSAATASRPFVVGQWVRGDSFYGRREELAEILDGNRNGIWLMGTRMVGKTSLLKQLELIARSEPESRYFPLFWDLQGIQAADELHRDFSGVLLDARERLSASGIPLGEVDTGDLFQSLAALRRALRSRELRLLLLCDEVEELIHLKDQDPALLPRLRRSLQSGDDLRCVLAASGRLWALADQRSATSPFLHGFTPPLYLGPLRFDEACALARQARLPAESRPPLSSEVVEQLCHASGGHPYLLQLLCCSVLEVGEVEAAIERVTADPTVGLLFEVDMETFAPRERDVLRALLPGSTGQDGLAHRMDADSATLAGSLHTLEGLGLVRRGGDGDYALANPLLARWLGTTAREPSAERDERS